MSFSWVKGHLDRGEGIVNGYAERTWSFGRLAYHVFVGTALHSMFLAEGCG